LVASGSVAGARDRRDRGDASRGHRFEETTFAMAGARKDRRSRLSGDSGDTPSGERLGNDVAGTVVSGTDWETPEVLAAMNDTDFARAVHRAVASHRKIFVNQERNWAAVRLRANLMPARVAAERARQGLGASGRVRARSKPVRAGDARDERVGDVAHRGGVASVVVKRFAKKGASAETRQAAPLEALPRADNVPRYSSYQYCADTNAHMPDEVPLKLLYADQEGEMRAASDDEEGEESSESDDEEPETNATTTTPEKSPPGARSASARIQVKTRLETHRVFLRSRKSRR
jgi:hypothetical protein